MGKIIVKKATAGLYYFNVIGNDGYILLNSERYSTIDACTNSIETIKKLGTELENYYSSDFKRAKGKYSFGIRHPNGVVLAYSIGYNSRSRRDSFKHITRWVFHNPVLLTELQIKVKPAPERLYTESDVIKLLEEQRQVHMDLCDMYSESHWVKTEIKGFYYPSLLKK